MSHTLDVETGGWIVVAVVYTFKTRHHDLHLLPACRTRQFRLSEAPQFCLRAHTVLVYDPFCSQISSGTLIADRASNQLFGTLQQLGRASTHFSDGHSHSHRLMRSAPLVCTSWTRGCWTCQRSHKMPPTMAVSYAFLRENEIAHLRLVRDCCSAAGLAKSCSAFPIKRSTLSAHSSTVISELLCTTAALRM